GGDVPMPLHSRRAWASVGALSGTRRFFKLDTGFLSIRSQLILQAEQRTPCPVSPSHARQPPTRRRRQDAVLFPTSGYRRTSRQLCRRPLSSLPASCLLRRNCWASLPTRI